MNVTTLIDNIKDAITGDSDLNGWCRTNYDRAPTVYKGLDERNPPAEANYPAIHLYPVGKTVGYELNDKGHIIGVSCGILDTTLTASTGEVNDSLRSATYKWTASGEGTNEYYCELAAGGDPSLNEPDGLKINGVAADAGTLGSLAAGEWAWGDNDTLGYNTVYVRLSDGADPDTKTPYYIQTADTVTLNEYAGIDNLEAFRKLIETAVVGAVSSPMFVNRLNINYETVEFFPFFLADMEFHVGEEYSLGDGVFD